MRIGHLYYEAAAWVRGPGSVGPVSGEKGGKRQRSGATRFSVERKGEVENTDSRGRGSVCGGSERRDKGKVNGGGDE